MGRGLNAKAARNLLYRDPSNFPGVFRRLRVLEPHMKMKCDLSGCDFKFNVVRGLSVHYDVVDVCSAANWFTLVTREGCMTGGFVTLLPMVLPMLLLRLLPQCR
ncbi:hypothetical protein SOVF_114910 [Spinacia oleracea]|uniref:Uncharacterized protein n=1 Tax=Spinacia oleracea TaxID=3562 RepID=A0ABM3R6Y4_SPIOL|nr:uncharacterized protein LOC130466823 [Spinacia oleracea]KNA13633.1 hypothetical protein SOVF_114910 [Spinacia oleracea]